jgi:TRAP-type C4-dicarboxylate transport system permease small subunit
LNDKHHQKEELSLGNKKSRSKTKPVPAPQQSSPGILTKILDVIMNLTLNFDAILIAAMTLIINWQVINRYNPNLNTPWTEEVAIILLVWFGLTGAAIGIRKDAHIGMEFVVNTLPPKVRRILRIFVQFIVMTFAVFLFYTGIQLAKGCWNIQLSVTLWSRGAVVYSAIPVAAVLMVVFALEDFFKQIRGKTDSNTKKEPGEMEVHAQ